MENKPEALQDTRQQYQTLHDSIEHAREVCTDPSKRSDLRHKAEAIQDILSSLDEENLLSRTADFKAVGKQIASVNSDMENLKSEISQIVQDVSCASKVASAVDSALSASAKLFA